MVVSFHSSNISTLRLERQQTADLSGPVGRCISLHKLLPCISKPLSLRGCGRCLLDSSIKLRYGSPVRNLTSKMRCHNSRASTVSRTVLSAGSTRSHLSPFITAVIKSSVMLRALLRLKHLRLVSPPVGSRKFINSTTSG